MPEKKKEPKAMQVDKEEQKYERPGVLRGDAKMEVQTWQCDRLVRGRKKKEGKEPIIGLIGFSRSVHQIIIGAGADDPYADMYLLNIDEAIENASKRIADFSEDIAALLASTQGISINIASSIKPKPIDLSFANSYGYRGAYLLADYDRLVRSILTCKHVGKIRSTNAHAIIEACAGYIRSTFAMPTTYKYMAIKREDVRQGTKRALEAQKMMGEIPADILSGKLRSEHAPPIHSVSLDEDDGDDDAMELNELEAAQV